MRSSCRERKEKLTEASGSNRGESVLEMEWHILTPDLG